MGQVRKCDPNEKMRSNLHREISTSHRTKSATDIIESDNNRSEGHAALLSRMRSRELTNACGHVSPSGQQQEQNQSPVLHGSILPLQASTDTVPEELQKSGPH